MPAELGSWRFEVASPDGSAWSGSGAEAPWNARVNLPFRGRRAYQVIPAGFVEGGREGGSCFDGKWLADGKNSGIV